MNKLFFAGIIVLASLGFFVFAQTLTGNGVVVNALNCSESDGGLNYLSAGAIHGSFVWNSTNGTQSWIGSVSDVCLNNITLVESVCGSSISPSYNGFAGAFYVDCSIRAGNSTNSTYRGLCGQGRCY